MGPRSAATTSGTSMWCGAGRSRATVSPTSGAVGREDAEVTVAAGTELSGWDDRDPWTERERNALGCSGSGERGLPALRERADVGARHDRTGLNGARATPIASVTGSPVPTIRSPPRSRRAARKSWRQSSRNWTRLGAARWRMVSSRTKSGTIRLAVVTAASRAGWSLRRRSRLNKTTAASITRFSLCHRREPPPLVRSRRGRYEHRGPTTRPPRRAEHAPRRRSPRRPRARAR